MAIVFDKSFILLTPPKTGSQWIKSSLINVSAPVEVIDADNVNGHGDLSYYGTGYNFTACFVRKPEDWIESYWFYRERNQSWEERWAIDRLCGIRAKGHFQRFLELYEENCKGYISNMFRGYTHKGSTQIDFIGRQEGLSDEFQRLLSERGISFDREKILDMAPINVGSKKMMNSDQRGRIRDFEAWAYDEYGYI
jgi:hypothetical protein